MGIKLTEAELDEFLSAGHTLTVATTRKSGEPFMMPIWYVWMDGAFWVRTGASSAKVKHIRRDPRVCCLLEDGEKWADLRAVIASCDAEIVIEEAQTARVAAAIDAKYASYRMDSGAAPDATRNAYSSPRAFIKMTPREIRSWYNRKIKMKPAAA